MNDYFHQKYGRVMVAKYRTKGQVKFGTKFYDNKNETDFNGCPLKVSKVQEQIFLFSYEPNTERNYFLISALGI